MTVFKSDLAKIAIVVPVLNDWASFMELCRKIERCTSACNAHFSVFAVDDGSSDALQDFPGSIDVFCNITSIKILHLACNLGHQRAIAVGLAEVFAQESYDSVIVMDSDGEDKPDDISKLMAASVDNPGAIIVAKRAERSEGLSFRIFYGLYKAVFSMLTGKNIDFGNFCLIRQPLLGRILHMSECWNHLAGTVVKSRVKLVRVDTARGTRFTGESKMNLVSLILHGLGAMSVFSDTIFVRSLIASIVLSGFVFLIGLSVIFTRLLTNLAIPGWASIFGGLTAVILFQVLSFSAYSVFLQLNNRSNVAFIPALDARRFIQGQSVVFGGSKL